MPNRRQSAISATPTLASRPSYLVDDDSDEDGDDDDDSMMTMMRRRRRRRRRLTVMTPTMGMVMVFV